MTTVCEQEYAVWTNCVPTVSHPRLDYPLVMSDDAAGTVSHVACALELTTDLLVDLSPSFTHQPHMLISFLSPHQHLLCIQKEKVMQATNSEDIKAAL